MSTHTDRKNTPIYSGVVRYFPDALREVARVSKAGNDQHNPGQPLHWAKEKSTDHEDCIVRHLTDHAAGELRDEDGQLHLAKVAWRALAALQTLLEKEREPKYTPYLTAGPYVFCNDCGVMLDVPAPAACLYPGRHHRAA